MLVADYDTDGQHLVYSTSELMTHLAQGGQDVALLHGRAGEGGETVLRYRSAPTVKVLAGEVSRLTRPPGTSGSTTRTTVLPRSRSRAVGARR
jgi:hypothetical protein